MIIGKNIQLSQLNLFTAVATGKLQIILHNISFSCYSAYGFVLLTRSPFEFNLMNKTTQKRGEAQHTSIWFPPYHCLILIVLNSLTRWKITLACVWIQACFYVCVCVCEHVFDVLFIRHFFFSSLFVEATASLASSTSPYNCSLVRICHDTSIGLQPLSQTAACSPNGVALFFPQYLIQPAFVPHSTIWRCH